MGDGTSETSSILPDPNAARLAGWVKACRRIRVICPHHNGPFRTTMPQFLVSPACNFMLDYYNVQADFMSEFTYLELPSNPSTPLCRLSIRSEDEFHSPLEPSPANAKSHMWEEDLRMSEAENSSTFWDGHTRIISGLNHLISMPAGPGWKEIHIQPSDTLQVIAEEFHL